MIERPGAKKLVNKTSKGSGIIIDLIKTKEGYTLYEPAVQSQPQQPTTKRPPSTQMSVNNSNNSLYYIPAAVPAKHEPPRVQIVLPPNCHDDSVLVRSTYEAKELKYTTLASVRQCAPWFNLNVVHENQLRAIRLWVLERQQTNDQKSQRDETQFVKDLDSIRDGSLQLCQQELEKRIDSYRTYRNKMVELYIAGDQEYLSILTVLKHIPADASFLLQIWVYLVSIGVLNIGHINLALEKPKTYRCAKQDPVATPLSKIPDQNTILCQLSSQLRPHCDYCGTQCGIVWFQHQRYSELKDSSQQVKTTYGRNPPLSGHQYEIITEVSKDYSLQRMLLQRQLPTPANSSRLQES